MFEEEVFIGQITLNVNNHILLSFNHCKSSNEVVAVNQLKLTSILPENTASNIYKNIRTINYKTNI